jgi:hypothetical protein
LLWQLFFRCHPERSEATVCFVKVKFPGLGIMEKWKPKDGFHFSTISATAPGQPLDSPNPNPEYC